MEGCERSCGGVEAKIGAVEGLLTSVRSSVPDPWHFGTDLYFWLKDPDAAPDPAFLISDLQDAKKNFIIPFRFEGTFTSFFKDKKS
jgi:hypothetical protein